MMIFGEKRAKLPGGPVSCRRTSSVRGCVEAAVAAHGAPGSAVFFGDNGERKGGSTADHPETASGRAFRPSP